MSINRSQGFTIIELLVVIIVIAILTAIVTVIFFNYQTRAIDARILAIVNQWEKIVRMYATQTDTYPRVDQLDGSPFTTYGSIEFCLGDTPISDSYAAGTCAKNSSGGPYNFSNLKSLFVQQNINTPSSEIGWIKFTPSGNSDRRALTLIGDQNKKTNYSIVYPLKNAKCSGTDVVNSELTADGNYMTGASGQGTNGRAKMCSRVLPDIP